jgi:23S rRNA (guanosine2251-2'-O)-methyltransferase
VTNLARALEQLKERGLWVAGTVETGGTDPREEDLTGPLVVVVGSEHRGIRPLVLRQCDLRLTIPSASAIASLNVAAAATALLYEVARQRRTQL